MFKIYKSNQVNVGEGRQIEFKSKVSEKSTETISDDCEMTDNINEKISHDEHQHEIMIEEIEKKKDEILDNAEKEAEKILLTAREESKNITEKAKEEGYEQGYQDGLENGQQQGYEEMTQLIDEAAEMKRNIYAEREMKAKELEKDIVHLVVKTVRRIIQAELQENQELIFNLIEEGLKECNYTDNLIVHVSEMDYDLVYAYKNRIYLMTDGIRDINIKSDPSMGLGSVIIETASGQVDASVETQIKKIENYFFDLYQSEG
ncbi:flagellar assembly protein FliH [Tindallia magadiensis]|uniref:Flagellar assembly protein FliH n=1 Tax=Tindallia magadiensis TaxID=69895 RepID=A0A1I3AJX6_9FIRM|nr:FliH/SctL family protein [Tindallia magadiensis]SFH50345.1 flagellar assembly protein FliH [Tindallia magadiensis]